MKRERKEFQLTWNEGSRGQGKAVQPNETLKLKEDGNKNIEPYFIIFRYKDQELLYPSYPSLSLIYQHPEMSLVLLRRWKRVSAGSKPCSWAPNRAQPGVLAT